MSLAPGHNHPVVFRREGTDRPIHRPRPMSEKTYKRVKLTLLSHSQPRTPTEKLDAYITRLSSKVAMKPPEVRAFLFGPLLRPKAEGRYGRHDPEGLRPLTL